jgi:hypothetical protein
MADSLISTASTLVFDPATEYQELEEFEFDELVERPEAIRFFTLEEQTTDYFNKLLPASGRVPKSVLRDSEHEVDMMTDLYSKVVLETESGYDVQPSPAPSNIAWASYFSKQKPVWTPYDFNVNWLPLFQPGRRNVPYQVFLDALPKQNYFEGSAQPLLPKERDRIVYQDGTYKEVYALGPVLYNKTAYREDGTFRIQVLERGETQDKVKTDGYYILPPPLEPPNPLEDHPFLSRRTEPITLDSTEPLKNLLPSLDTVLQHAVPDSTNPQDAVPYLQIWNLRLSQIPYSIWTTKFKPVETISEVPVPLELDPVKPLTDEATPPQTLLEVYGNTWVPGVATRHWLSRQLDAGMYAVKILQALVGKQPLIEVRPPGLPEGVIPKSTPEECLPSNIQDFTDFAQRGVYRNGQCYPLAYIEEERSQRIYTDKLPFTPNLPETLPGDHRKLLQDRYYVEPGYQGPVYEKAPVPEPPNEIRSQVMALLQDDSQLPSDITKNILTLFRDIAPMPEAKNHIYRDPTTNAFLICEHTLRQLEGDYARDPAEFKRIWTDQAEGSIHCMYCGEEISNQVFVVQDQFDEDGRALVSYGVLATKTFQADHVTKTFVASLNELKELFDLNEPGQDIMFLLLSLFQVVPDEDKLKPLVDYVRGETLKVKSKVKTVDSKVELLLSVFGFNAMVTLLLTHRPTLLPRRVFGSKPIQLRGFPRDTEDLNDAPLVDSLLFLLKTTFESYPTTFRGSSVVFLRTLLKDQRGVKQRILNSLKAQFLPKFKDLYEQAKEEIPPTETHAINTFEAPLLRYAGSDFLKPTERLGKENLNVVFCPDPIPLWFDPAGVYPRFEETRITTQILPAVSSERVVPSMEGILQGVVPDKQEVVSRARLTLPKEFPSPTLKKLTESTDSVTLQRSLDLVLTLLNTQIKEGPLRAQLHDLRAKSQKAVGDASLLRDYFKGLLLEIAKALDTPTTVNLERELVRNLSVRAMLASADAAKSVAQKLRAQETEQFKQQLRGMTDAEREVTQKLLQLSVVPYLITKKDREEYMRELAKQLDTLEPPVDPATLAPGQPEDPSDIPEEGLNRDRDVGPQGDDVFVDEHQLETDYGDYGDRRNRAADGEEFVDLPALDYQEGYGSAV